MSQISEQDKRVQKMKKVPNYEQEITGPAQMFDYS
jgi:hypothetical protein